VVAELRDAGVTLPIIATGGVRTFDDCREYFWAGADAVSLGSATWLAATPRYALAPLEGLRIRALLRRVERYVPPRVRGVTGADAADAGVRWGR
jgi:dihydroorotate dehydrogenase (NAD+) catalytic subunit